MSETWILVAQRAQAKIYEHSKKKDELKLLHEVDHPEGRLQNKDIDADRPARNRSAGSGKFSVYAREQEAKEHVSEVFAKKLTEMLDKSQTQNKFANLILVAEPHFLGLLRQNLKPPVAAKVCQTVNKDVAHFSDHELKQKLHEIVNS
jgi:protein required for attachment to host cells